jgi:dihydrofolate reductase
MTKVIFDMSMSLDGYVTASGQTAEEPLGKGGERLHEWAFGNDERNREMLERAMGSIGAMIAGRRTYDDSIPWWGPDGPSGSRRVPLIVVTHEEPSDIPENSVYTFVTDGIEAAVDAAKAAAGDKDVAVMGGPDVGRQFIAAGLVDEISVHLVPVLFGGGTRLVEHLDEQVKLEPPEVVQTADATHMSFRVRPR